MNNKIIKKWDEEIAELEEVIGVTSLEDYLSEIDNLKVIDLKYLEEIDVNRLALKAKDIMREVNKERQRGLEEEETEYTSCVDYNSKLDICDNYYRCVFCMLDYLIDIKRIKIIV